MRSSSQISFSEARDSESDSDSDSDVSTFFVFLLCELMALELKLALFQLGLRGSSEKLCDRRFAILS